MSKISMESEALLEAPLSAIHTVMDEMEFTLSHLRSLNIQLQRQQHQNSQQGIPTPLRNGSGSASIITNGSVPFPSTSSALPLTSASALVTDPETNVGSSSSAKLTKSSKSIKSSKSGKKSKKGSGTGDDGEGMDGGKDEKRGRMFGRKRHHSVPDILSAYPTLNTTTTAPTLSFTTPSTPTGLSIPPSPASSSIGNGSSTVQQMTYPLPPVPSLPSGISGSAPVLINPSSQNARPVSYLVPPSLTNGSTATSSSGQGQGLVDLGSVSDSAATGGSSVRPRSGTSFTNSTKVISASPAKMERKLSKLEKKEKEKEEKKEREREREIRKEREREQATSGLGHKSGLSGGSAGGSSSKKKGVLGGIFGRRPSSHRSVTSPVLGTLATTQVPPGSGSAGPSSTVGLGLGISPSSMAMGPRASTSTSTTTSTHPSFGPSSHSFEHHQHQRNMFINSLQQGGSGSGNGQQRYSEDPATLINNLSSQLTNLRMHHSTLISLLPYSLQVASRTGSGSRRRGSTGSDETDPYRGEQGYYTPQMERSPQMDRSPGSNGMRHQRSYGGLPSPTPNELGLGLGYMARKGSDHTQMTSEQATIYPRSDSGSRSRSPTLNRRSSWDETVGKKLLSNGMGSHHDLTPNGNHQQELRLFRFAEDQSTPGANLQRSITVSTTSENDYNSATGSPGGRRPSHNHRQSLVSLFSEVASIYYDAEIDFDDEEEEPTTPAGVDGVEMDEVEQTLAAAVEKKTPPATAVALPAVDSGIVGSSTAVNGNAVERRARAGTVIGPVIRRKALPAPTPAQEPSLIGMLKKNVGKDMSSISFPITFNEPISLTQKMAEEVEYVSLLAKAATCKDPIERIALVTAFAITAYTNGRYRTSRKPFNPLMGETYEMVREDLGVRFLAEKVRHHPPKLACMADGKGWKYWGTSWAVNKLSGMSLEIKPIGKMHVELTTFGEEYVWTKPPSYMRNLVTGTKYLETIGELHMANTKTGETSVVTFKEGGWGGGGRNHVNGVICDHTGSKVAWVEGVWDTSLSLRKGPPKAIPEPLWKVTPWPANPEKNYGFTAYGMELNELTPDLIGEIAPSDSRFRPDQRAVENGNFPLAETLKVKMESQQRARKAAGNQFAARWFQPIVGDEEEWEYKESRGYWEVKENDELQEAAARPFDP